MAAENKPKTGNTTGKGKKRKQFLPHNRPVKKKGSYPLMPGVQGFFITCDGGREYQAAREALYVIESFFDELVDGNGNGNASVMKIGGIQNKPQNKKIVFASSSDEEDDEDDDSSDEEKVVEKEGKDEEKKSDTCEDGDASHENATNANPQSQDLVDAGEKKEIEKVTNDKKEDASNYEQEKANESEEPPVKKQCVEEDSAKCATNGKVEKKSIDKLIEDEIKELGDKAKRRFMKLDAGCNGLVFIQMRKGEGDPGPKEIVQHMMITAASKSRHMSRFILRVLPVEVACYASEEEIQRAIQPLVTQYFPVETQNPQKFAVMYGARANSGIDRMKIINSVAKSIPAPHKVDLSNPDKTIIVEVVKTVCLIGVIEKYKELSKYNLRQLTSSKN